MAAELMPGAPVADAVLERVGTRVEEMKAAGVTPGLATILVGDDGPSAGYVARKHEACERIGLNSFNIEIPADAGQETLLDTIDELNADADVDAYLLQLPVPPGFDGGEALARIDPGKDADGLHPMNLGRLVLQEEGPVPCTPAGIAAMFDHYGIDTAGKNLVVVGRGPTLGRPMALMMSNRGADAAVTVVHSRIPDLVEYTRRADILIGAVGIPNFITPDMVKPGAIAVSGGITWEGRKLLPDVAEDVGEVASWITPRLGGVGPTTIAMLLRNTVRAAESRMV